MYIVRTVTVQIDVRLHPFRDGETLYSYAHRMLSERCIEAHIDEVIGKVSTVPLGTQGDPHGRLVTQDQIIIRATQV